MSRKLTAVVENGEERAQAFDQALDSLGQEARNYPQEWWDEFQRDLEENRVNFGALIDFEDPA